MASTCKSQCFDFVSQCSTTLNQFGLSIPNCATGLNQAGLEAYPFSQSIIQVSPFFQVRSLSHLRTPTHSLILIQLAD